MISFFHGESMDAYQAAMEAIARSNGWLPDEVPEEYQGQGFLAFRDLPDGRLLAVVPLLFGRAQLTLGNGRNRVTYYHWDEKKEHSCRIGYDGCFDQSKAFESPRLAVEAMLAFGDDEVSL